MPNVGEPVADVAGSSSVMDLLVAASKKAVLDSASECSRAEGKRGMVYLNVELCLGDGGDLMWIASSVYFRQKRHRKDAVARETADV